MKVLVIGYTGNLGSKILERLVEYKYEVIAVGRMHPEYQPLQKVTYIEYEIDDGYGKLRQYIKSHKPTYVINCVGLIKHRDIISTYEYYKVNAEFPLVLSQICLQIGSKLIHFSTDCIFDGSTGNYTENDIASANDDYGLSKYLGEIHHADYAVTIRKSLIGHSLYRKTGLLDWFLQQKGKVPGYAEQYFSGPTSLELSKITVDYILNNFTPGLFHVTGNCISKYELLIKIKEIYGLHECEVEFDNCVKINRSLDSAKFQKHYGYIPKTWDYLISEMHDDFFKNIIKN